jgi:SnoaL-like polyketide cyclase
VTAHADISGNEQQRDVQRFHEAMNSRDRRSSQRRSTRSSVRTCCSTPGAKCCGWGPGSHRPGRAVTYNEIFVLRFADSRIAEIWGVVDVLAQLRQLGTIPAQHPRTAKGTTIMILITGANGVVGRQVPNLLPRAGTAVTAVTRGPR